MLIGLTRMPDAPLMLLRLWGHCEERRDDVLENAPEILAAICNWSENPDELRAHLLQCRFIEKHGRKLLVRGWRERNASLLARIENGKRGGRPKGKITEEKAGAGKEPIGYAQDSGGITEAEPESNRNLSVECSGVECSGVSPKGPQSENGELRAPELLSRLCTLFSRKNQRASNAEETIAMTVRITDAELGLIERFYREARAMEEPPMLKQKIVTFLGDIYGELDRARSFLGGAAEKKPAAEKKEPAGWREIVHGRFAGATLPASYWELPRDIRAQFPELE